MSMVYGQILLGAPTLMRWLVDSAPRRYCKDTTHPALRMIVMEQIRGCLGGKRSHRATVGSHSHPGRFQEIYYGAMHFREGKAPVQQTGQWGYIDRDGNELIEP